MFIIDPRMKEDGEMTLPFGMIMHPKTGSQSMRDALRGQLKARNVAGLHGFDEEECEKIIEAGGCVVSTIRNPWDLMVSWWSYGNIKVEARGDKPASFLYWLPRILEAGNGWIEKGLFFGADHCNCFFRFEHDLEYQLNNLLETCGLPAVELGHWSKTNHTHYVDYYDIPSAIAVDRYFRNEIAEWGYEFGDPERPVKM